MEEYTRARKLGEKEYRRAVQTGHFPYLPALSYMLGEGDQRPEIRVGIMEIPVSMIAGTFTQGRQNAFASNFMPLLADDTEFASKWSSLFLSQTEEGLREPIKVYEYMRRFYVLEGNKRVSVARYLDLPVISAEVTRLIPPRTQDPESVLYYEFLEFFQAVPIYTIEFSEPGSYKKLSEELGLSLDSPWPDERAADLRAAFNTFVRLYESLGGNRLSITSGDAFLLYIMVFRLESLLNDKEAEIKRRTLVLWKEYLAETKENPVSIVEKPPEGEKQGRLVSSLAGSLTQNMPGLMKSVLKMKPAYTEKNPLRITFIYDRAPEDSGWIYGHECGRLDLAALFPGIIKTEAKVADSSDEAFEDAVRKAVEEGTDMVFTTSPVQMERTLRAAVAWPKVRFLNCSLNISRSLVRTYYARMYEAKFLMGALAAAMAENHLIGYQADYPIYGTIANINAFAIGVAMIDPRAKVVLKWSTQKDSDWEKEFLDMGISVISGPDLTKPKELASGAYGIYQVSPSGDVLNLAMPVWNWGRYYELIARTVLDGSWEAKALTRTDQALNYWYGMASGVIDVTLSDELPYYSRKMVGLLKNALIAETLNPFDGELHSRGGLIKAADAPRLSYEEIITMGWLNDNVLGELPAYETLTDGAKEAVSVSGVSENDPACGDPPGEEEI